MKLINWILVIIIFAGISCKSNREFTTAYNSINADDLALYVSKLGSDEFMGRAPFTEGEDITIKYLEEELKKIGFSPAFGDSYIQEVPMVSVQSEITEPVVIETPDNTFRFKWPDDVAISSARVAEEVSVSDSPLVFAGFGISADEYEWDDYNDMDVSGKTVVVLVNDPGLYTGDDKLFKGREMTYYGRWTYKYEEAAKRGASGILIIHETEGAGYTYGIPRNSAMTPNLYMATGNGNEDKCMFNGWIEAEAADKLFSDLGYNIKELRMEACKRGFTGFDMGSTLSLKLTNKSEFNSSYNVAGVLEGKDHPDEVIIYSGHWDHFGIGEVQDGDSIYNGAVDNGTTMAMMFEVGEAFVSLEERPSRSIMLFFPTAEEQGLLGSNYYVENPAFPIEMTVANINNDLVLPIGRMRDVMVTGYGQSDLDDYLAVAAMAQGRYIFPDPDAHTGMYFRSDHFSFAKKGVPALFARGNCDSREHGKEWAAEQEKDYIDTKYHKAADNYYPELWDMSGIVEDAQLSFDIGYQLANSDKWPGWKEGSEFKSLRSKLE
jgi:Zn-dependent M28 family amino/carboxypeptidase